MSKRVKYSLEVKIRIVEIFLSRKYRICEIKKTELTEMQSIDEFARSNTTVLMD